MDSKLDCIWTRRHRRRQALLKKGGQSNIRYCRIPKKSVRYIKDLYITLLDLNWTCVLLLLFVAMFASYLVFSVLYFMLSYVHGDFESYGENSTHQHCIHNLRNFWDALLFSMETQSTIGYGTIFPNASCSGTIPVIYTQVTVGFLLETLLLGFIFVKMARPKHRRHTLIFSQNACLCIEDQQMTLQVRVGDIRNSHLIDCHVYGALVKRYECQEKNVYPLYQHELKFEAHGMKNNLFLIWPLILGHKISKHSPLYSLTPQELQRDHFEMLIFLEGTIESTGEMLQARTSYTNHEVLWGHRFAQLEEYDTKNEVWYMNFDKFNKVEPCATPPCSAQALAVTRASQSQKEEDKSKRVAENHVNHH